MCNGQRTGAWIETARDPFGTTDALPRHESDLPNVAFGAQTTLAYR